MTPGQIRSQLAIYETAALIKLADERFRRVLASGQAAHAFYSPRGQEIVAAAVGVTLRRRDYVVTTYRGLHDHIAKGVRLKELRAEFYGMATGTCKGKGGPIHITHPASGLMVRTGIVGSGLAIANGLALASKLRGEDRVTVCNFGDGATNIGAFHEALNLASVWKLPVVFLCQNNRYAEHTPFAKRTSALMDESVFLLGEDIADDAGGGAFKATQGLSSKYGVDRVRTTSISEQAIVGAAVGAGRAPKLPGGGFAAQHSDMFEAWLAHTTRPQGRDPLVSVRGQGPAAVMHLRRRPLHLRRELATL